jgi:hypothetical protein
MDARKRLEQIIDTRGLSDEEVSQLWKNWYEQVVCLPFMRWSLCGALLEGKILCLSKVTELEL